MLPLEMMHTALQTCALGAHMRTDARRALNFCTYNPPYTVEAMSQRHTTAMAVRTAVLASLATQPKVMDAAEAPVCMRARGLVGESTGTGGEQMAKEQAR